MIYTVSVGLCLRVLQGQRDPHLFLERLLFVSLIPLARLPLSFYTEHRREDEHNPWNIVFCPGVMGVDSSLNPRRPVSWDWIVSIPCKFVPVRASSCPAFGKILATRRDVTSGQFQPISIKPQLAFLLGA
jgi:hypothetical protein